MTNTTPKAVARFSYDEVNMRNDVFGMWVLYIDYFVLSAQLEAANQRAEKAEVEAEFFQSEVKLRNRIPTTSEAMAEMLKRADTAHAQGKAEGLREAAEACENHRYGYPNKMLDICNLRKTHRNDIAAKIRALIPADAAHWGNTNISEIKETSNG